jgi:serine/threonine protein kinase
LLKPPPPSPILTVDDPVRVGRYKIQNVLGQGGMGRVYLGVAPVSGPAAIKVMHARFARDPDFRARFAHEAALARRVVSLRTAKVLDSGLYENVPWLATEFIDGRNLQDMVSADGRLCEPDVRALASGLAAALADIHRCQIIHRDLKPANVIVAGGMPRVIDFGIARAFDEDGMTGHGQVMGTHHYMSPEHAVGEPLSPASDIYSLGAVLVFAATGRPPDFSPSAGAGPFSPDLRGVPDGLRVVVRWCLERDPRDRPALSQVQAVVGSAAGSKKIITVSLPGSPGLPRLPGSGTGSSAGPGWRRGAPTAPPSVAASGGKPSGGAVPRFTPSRPGASAAPPTPAGNPVSAAPSSPVASPASAATSVAAATPASATPSGSGRSASTSGSVAPPLTRPEPAAPDPRSAGSPRREPGDRAAPFAPCRNIPNGNVPDGASRDGARNQAVRPGASRAWGRYRAFSQHAADRAQAWPVLSVPVLRRLTLAWLALATLTMAEVVSRTPAAARIGHGHRTWLATAHSVQVSIRQFTGHFPDPLSGWLHAATSAAQFNNRLIALPLLLTVLALAARRIRRQHLLPVLTKAAALAAGTVLAGLLTLRLLHTGFASVIHTVQVLGWWSLLAAGLTAVIAVPLAGRVR